MCLVCGMPATLAGHHAIDRADKQDRGVPLSDDESASRANDDDWQNRQPDSELEEPPAPLRPTASGRSRRTPSTASGVITIHVRSFVCAILSYTLLSTGLFLKFITQSLSCIGQDEVICISGSDSDSAPENSSSSIESMSSEVCQRCCTSRLCI
jgi:hypothetical protein